MLSKKWKTKLDAFLRDFGWAWYWINEPAKLLSKYFKIDNGQGVYLKIYWEEHIYLGNISDVSLDDVQNVANTIKVLVNNYLKNEEERFHLT